MQQRDQPRAAFVDKAKFLGDPGGLDASSAEGRPNPGLQSSALWGVILLELPPTSKWLSLYNKEHDMASFLIQRRQSRRAQFPQ